jgi:site-specific recombinase XerD
MKVSAVLIGAKDNIGRQRLYIRISDKQKRLHYKTPIFLNPDTDFKKGKVVATHPHATVLNKEIKRLIVEKEAEVHGLFEQKGKVKDTPFKDYALDLFNRLDKEREAGTIRYYIGQLDKFLRFAPGITLNSITDTTLEGYKQWCYSEGNGVNGVWSSLKFLKLVLRKAKSERRLKENPFDYYKMPAYQEPKKEYLTPEQIERINAFRMDEYTPEDLRFCATWFLIGCYTGLRYSDMHRFDRDKHIIKGRIVIYTQKTAEPISLPLNTKVKEWLTAVEYKRMHFTNEHYNRLLKLVAAGAKVKAKLTTHTARHSFAMMCADLGVTIEEAAAMLGHKDLKNTKVYYKLSGKRIDTAYGKLS